MNLTLSVTTRQQRISLSHDDVQVVAGTGGDVRLTAHEQTQDGELVLGTLVRSGAHQDGRGAPALGDEDRLAGSSGTFDDGGVLTQIADGNNVGDGTISGTSFASVDGTTKTIVREGPRWSQRPPKAISCSGREAPGT